MEFNTALKTSAIPASAKAAMLRKRIPDFGSSQKKPRKRTNSG
jgi:hypothetical protein